MRHKGNLRANMLFLTLTQNNSHENILRAEEISLRKTITNKGICGNCLKNI